VKATSQSLRTISFRASLLASVTAIAMIPFYERWFTKLGWAALTSDTLRVWLDCGIAASAIALLGSLFGRGPWRVVAFLLSVIEIYFWFVLSIAV
jgi:hypothetical protein